MSPQEGCVDILHDGVWQYTVTAPELLGASAALAVADANLLLGNELQPSGKQQQQEEAQGEKRRIIKDGGRKEAWEVKQGRGIELEGGDAENREGVGRGAGGLDENEDLLKGVAGDVDERRGGGYVNQGAGVLDGRKADAAASAAARRGGDVERSGEDRRGYGTAEDSKQQGGGFSQSKEKGKQHNEVREEAGGRQHQKHSDEEQESSQEKATGSLDDFDEQQHRFRPYTLRCRTSVSAWHLPLLSLESLVIRFPELRENLVEVWRARRTERMRVVE